MPPDERNETNGAKPRRERSTRYPGVTLAEVLKLCESIEELGVDGLPAADIASALGYKSIKTNTFSAPLSAARQFGMLSLTGEGYALTPLAREILHPVDPANLPALLRQALRKPPLYAELVERLGGKKVPDPTILGNILYHNHQIIASAKQQAAEAFLESARFAGALGADNVFRVDGNVAAPPATPAEEPPTIPRPSTARPARPRPTGEIVRLDMRLWDLDDGKIIRLRAPESISRASFDRFLQAFRLLVRVDDPPEPEGARDP
jgi:hypothetical protein